VLETVPRKEDLNWRKVGKTQARAWHTGLSGGAPDSVRCPRLARRQLGALGKSERRRGYKSSDCPVVHRTVRWANCASGQRSAARSARDTWSRQGRLGTPDSVRCTNRSRGPTVDCIRYERRSCTRPLQWMSGGAPDCPVHHSIEGKKCLPSWSPMAPSCLGAIKGTPRRMEQNNQASSKHSKTPRLRLHAVDWLC
jgi:hypothetical protein